MTDEHSNQRPYPLSWVDRLIASIERLPGPYWLAYLTGFGLLSALFVGMQAAVGGASGYRFSGWHIFIATQPLVGVLLVHDLHRVARSALRIFRTALTLDGQEYDEVLFRMTTLPRWQARVAAIVGPLLFILLFALPEDLESLPVVMRLPDERAALALLFVFMLMTWATYSTWALSMIRKLRLIHWLYEQKAVVDPFHPQPLHSPSQVTLRAAMTTLGLTYAWLLFNARGSLADFYPDPSLILTNAFFVGLGLLMFVWPLWGAHRLLEDAKREALSENASRFRAAVDELHRRVDSREVEGVGQWQNALSGLNVERNELKQMATWPWDPGTFRNLLAALIIPILVWTVQFGLQQILE